MISYTLLLNFYPNINYLECKFKKSKMSEEKKERKDQLDINRDAELHCQEQTEARRQLTEYSKLTECQVSGRQILQISDVFTGCYPTLLQIDPRCL
jgi:hypothetical protein